MMAADTMEALGIRRGSYVVKCNNRKIFDGVLETLGLHGSAHAEQRLTVLRAIISSTGWGCRACTSCSGRGAKTKAVISLKGPASRKLNGAT